MGTTTVAASGRREPSGASPKSLRPDSDSRCCRLGASGIQHKFSGAELILVCRCPRTLGSRSSLSSHSGFGIHHQFQVAAKRGATPACLWDQKLNAIRAGAISADRRWRVAVLPTSTTSTPASGDEQGRRNAINGDHPKSARRASLGVLRRRPLALVLVP
jgi:hypothetical protein